MVNLPSAKVFPAAQCPALCAIVALAAKASPSNAVLKCVEKVMCPLRYEYGFMETEIPLLVQFTTVFRPGRKEK